jgi:hypothetical protein
MILQGLTKQVDQQRAWRSVRTVSGVDRMAAGAPAAGIKNQGSKTGFKDQAQRSSSKVELKIQTRHSSSKLR